MNYFFFRLLVYMNFNKLVEYIILLSLFIATIGAAYVFIITIIFKQTTFSGFYSSWQFPTLLAIFIDSAFYEHISRL